ncbi:MAG: preprotein translocase subunit YajC [Acidobacteriota bacterium]|nr:preprotein translocase subunit YajC [Acidobacteriota bacterium]
MLLAAAKSSGSGSAILLIYVAVFVALYFFYIRPRSRRQKAARQEARQVEVGERAQTVGGFGGTVVRRDGQLVTLRTAGGAELDFVQSAIARRFDPVPESSDDAEESHPDDAAGDGAAEGDK